MDVSKGRYRWVMGWIWVCNDVQGCAQGQKEEQGGHGYDTGQNNINSNHHTHVITLEHQTKSEQASHYHTSSSSENTRLPRSYSMQEKSMVSKEDVYIGIHSLTCPTSSPQCQILYSLKALTADH